MYDTAPFDVFSGSSLPHRQLLQKAHMYDNPYLRFRQPIRVLSTCSAFPPDRSTPFAITRFEKKMEIAQPALQCCLAGEVGAKKSAMLALEKRSPRE